MTGKIQELWNKTEDKVKREIRKIRGWRDEKKKTGWRLINKEKEDWKKNKEGVNKKAGKKNKAGGKRKKKGGKIKGRLSEKEGRR